MMDEIRGHQRARICCRAMIAASAIATAASSAALADSAKAPSPLAADRSIWSQDTLTGDWGGTRTALKNKGIDFTINYIAETLGVVAGGLNRRVSYEGRLEFSVDADLERLIGWKGATTHVTVYQIHNGGYTAAENAGSIADPSNIDALATTRLFDLTGPF